MPNTFTSAAPQVQYSASHNAVLPTHQFRKTGASPVGGVVKRSFDVVCAGLALICLAPLMLGFALAIRLTSPGPALFGHVRVGHDGRLFKCWKFRTMVTNGPEILAAHLRDNPEARREWEATQKLRDDPRVTPLGRVLRALSIDELPQLLNILSGEMSIVGPRPVTEGELQRYGASATHYLRARPGLTGLWQISGRSDVSYERRVLMDRYYVANWSFASDVAIVAKTVPAVVMAKGSC